MSSTATDPKIAISGASNATDANPEMDLMRTWRSKGWITLNLDPGWVVPGRGWFTCGLHGTDHTRTHAFQSSACSNGTRWHQRGITYDFPRVTPPSPRPP